MPFSGDTFVRLYSWVVNRDLGIGIEPDLMDEDTDDIAAGLALCLRRDGTATVTADIPMNNHRIRGLSDPITNEDAANLRYLKNNYYTKTEVDDTFLTIEIAESDYARRERRIDTGAGLEGGGNLASDRVIKLNDLSVASLVKADNSVQLTGDQEVDGFKTFIANHLHANGVRSFYSNEEIQESNPATANTNGVTIGGDYIAASNAQIALFLNRRGTVGSGTIIDFRYAGVNVATVTISDTAVTYNTGSDHRLKKLVTNLSGSGAFIDALRPVDFFWIKNNAPDSGFLAHEFAEVCPQAVFGAKDGPEMQMMQASHTAVMANIIAELQSLRQRVAALGG